MFLNFVVKSKKSMVVLVCVTLIVFILIICYITRVTEKIMYGKEINFTESNISMNKYYAKYDMTIISNKNINTYSVKEWYDNNSNYSKLEYMDYMKNIVMIENKDNMCYITNSGNAAKIVTNGILENKNVSSLSTFVHLFSLAGTNCACTKNVYTNENKFSFVLEIADENCEITKSLGELKISKIELDVEDNKPINYVVYDENKKEYISIVYSEFILNEQEE